MKRAAELEESLEKWKKDHPNSRVEFPGASYIMLHSLSHLLISAISLECGYPLSSLRERIYAPDGKGAMEGRYGILIYTSSSGSEGTLGGLVQSARDIRKHIFRAMQLGTLCSNDPVCSSHGVKHGGIDRISGSACHGCLYISETSCERFNQFEEAKRDVIVASYVFYQCRGLLAPLAVKLDADPNFKVRFIVDLSHQRQHATEPLPIVANRFKTNFLSDLWSGNRQPEFWHDPRIFDEEDRKKAGVMHAKVVIIDSEAALVTSANFTEAAQNRNIEAGVIVRQSHQVACLRSYFEGLIDTGGLRMIL
ncbi:MAG: phospholipase D-like domain-containing protein [Verrucomicrobia bacterium]|nr:phospholipase D-like domain-containing protein [Verrucomicrobiota bacterium]